MPWVRDIPVGMIDATYLLQRSGAPRVESITLSHDPEAGLDTALANSLFDAFQTNVLPQLASAYTFVGVHALGRQDSANLVALDSTRTAAVGGRASTISNLSPPQVTFLVRKFTGFAGKRGRGRMYFPGVGEADTDAHGVVIGSLVTSMQTAFNAWHTNLFTFAKPMLGHSCFHADEDPPCTPPVWNQVTSFSVDDRIATQRRRLLR